MLFRTIILRSGRGATAIRVPDEIVEALGAGRYPGVLVTIREHVYRARVRTRDGESRVGLVPVHRKAAGVAAGDEVDVDIVLDGIPQEVAVAPDFAAALDAEPDARRIFEGLTYANQAWHVRAIEGAKRVETRARRIARSVANLKTGRSR